MTNTHNGPLDCVTGAFGYTGSRIASRLLAAGRRVRTLTNHPRADSPLSRDLEVRTLDFKDSAALSRSLEGAEVLYNTYWIRFPFRGVDFDGAVENTFALIRAAKRAGVRRVVHVSISHASPDSPLPYFRGKGQIETFLRDSDLSHAIVRPTLLFGGEDILINNIAWLLRRLPVFGIPGNGGYFVQPVCVDDVADLAVDSARAKENVVVEAAGPERFTFDELVSHVREAVDSRCRIIHLAPEVAIWTGGVLGWLVRDVLITRNEVRGLMDGLLVPEGVPKASTRFSTWLPAHAADLGRRYASEMKRRR